MREEGRQTVCVCALRRSCAQCVAVAVPEAEARLFVIFVAAAA